MTNDPKREPLCGEVLPPETPQMKPVRMPSETPFGLGFLGMARFEAIRRVIEARERALRAIVANIDAEADVDRALRRLAVARNELEGVGTEISQLARLAQLKRDLEILEVEEKIQAAKSRISSRSEPAPKPPPKPSDQDVFLEALKNIPGVITEARRVKEDIIRAAAGGALSPEDQAIIDSIDAMVQEFIARSGEKVR